MLSFTSVVTEANDNVVHEARIVFAIGLGGSDREALAVARLHADDGTFETGDDHLAADRELDRIAFAARVEHRAVGKLAGVVHTHLVAVLCCHCLAFPRGCVRLRGNEYRAVR